VIWWDGVMTPSEPFAPDATLADVGEFGLIAVLGGRFEQGAHVFVGPGDDAAVLRTPKGHVVVSTDLLVEGRHFRREWAEARDIGRKAAASDINAMGGTTHSLTVGLAAPADLPVKGALDLADGIAEEAAEVGASIVGGDLTTAKEVVVAITAMGTCEVAPVLRSGAQPGDVVAIAGRQGWAAAGLAVLGRGFRSPRVLVEAHQRPQPPYAAGPAAAVAGATAMIDVSDGLVADVGHIADDSGVAIDIRTSSFELADPMHAVGSALGVDPMQFILGGGEDHAIIATFGSATNLPEGFTAIGSVAEAGESGAVVTVDGAAYDGPSGWSHF
jgi:thiamine-monophosphate kinase